MNESIPWSKIGLGTGTLASLGRGTSQKIVCDLISWCAESGITVIDTADSYTSGRYETMLGIALRGKRGEAPTDSDIQSVIRIHELLDAWLRDSGCGRLEYWFPKEQLSEQICIMAKDGVRQNGTTRIAESPELEVADRDLKVFGTNNLYVCSGSLLPTSSQANPTFFTGVLAVKLAKHL